MADTYHLTTPIFADDDLPRDFQEMPNDDEAALSNEDRRAMEVVDRTNKCMDDFKFQISVSLRYIPLNLPNNVMVARNRLEQQRQSLTRKFEHIAKYPEKITRLKTQGYI